MKIITLGSCNPVMKLSIARLALCGSLGCIAAISFVSAQPIWVTTELGSSEISESNSTTSGPVNIPPDQSLELLCELVIADDKHQALETIKHSTDTSTPVEAGGERWMFLETPLFDVTYLSVAGGSDYAVEIYAERAYMFENFGEAKDWMSQYGDVYTEWNGESGKIAIGFGNVLEELRSDNENYLFSPMALTYVHEEGYIQAFNLAFLNEEELSNIHGFGNASVCKK